MLQNISSHIKILIDAHTKNGTEITDIGTNYRSSRRVFSETISKFYHIFLITVCNVVAARFCFTPLCHSVYRGWVWQTPPGIPPGQTPPRQTPPGRQHPPMGRHPPQETATAMNSTHPTGKHSCYVKNPWISQSSLDLFLKMIKQLYAWFNWIFWGLCGGQSIDY